MFRFRKKTKYLAYLFILFLPLYFIFVRPLSFSAGEFKLIHLASWPVKLISLPFQELKKMLTYHGTYETYKEQQKKIDGLQAKLVTFEELKSENTRLKRLLDLRSTFHDPSVAAHVIIRNPSYWNSSFVIDKGKTHGIKQGQAVIGPSGIIGKIIEVGQNRAKVILLTDPQFSVACLVERSRESGLVSGTLQGVCRLRYFNKAADIKVGDQVITSPLSSSFPEGLLVGKVVRVEGSAKDQLFQYIVEPAVSISQLEEVLVILK